MPEAKGPEGAESLVDEIVDGIIESDLGIDPSLAALARETEEACKQEIGRIDALARRNLGRVLRAFRENGLTDQDFGGTTGYGYDDRGREVAEAIFASVFGAEAAIVRHQIVSGTHALALCLFGLLRPGDEILFATGEPYDTLRDVVGMGRRVPGSCAELGITWRVVPRNVERRDLDVGEIRRSVGDRTRIVFIQRSRGYSWQPSVRAAEIEQIVRGVKAEKPDALVVVDNCYGEFTEDMEPTAVGADVAAGSLIKNPGGGIAPAGGYVVGRRELVQRVAARLTAPGVGGAVGPSLGHSRLILQGFFLAPVVVAESLAGTTVASRLFRALGYPTMPDEREARSDTVLAVRMFTRRRLLAFCRGFHVASPVNAKYSPEPSPLPGYADSVIMAGGTFVQGSSSELTVDAPLRPPYVAYVQGGLSRHHVMLAVLSGLTALSREDMLEPAAEREEEGGEDPLEGTG
ncbi:MAG: methionine gamma-lyase family protein [Firmicutes bacterium]|jgi:cystathionine beta-lyase family protein involved in aluminum resistance|nr:methionine gamma-lyase family protein [Bacillota bacterium]MDH7495106.1 methionine gamma-lyase family protein [Bacillota bacterium]